MGSIKHRNDMDLTEAEDIKKSWQEYTEELYMEQQTDSKSGKEYVKATYCHFAYLTYMQSTSCEMSGWMKHKLESRFLGEISKPQICR